MNTFIVLETNTFVRGTNEFCAGDERFSVGDERFENVFKFQPHIATHYQRLSNRTSLEIATHRYSPLKMGGSYHTPVLTSKHATPTIYICSSVLYWNKWPSSRLVDS